LLIAWRETWPTCCLRVPAVRQGEIAGPVLAIGAIRCMEAISAPAAAGKPSVWPSIWNRCLAWVWPSFLSRRAGRLHEHMPSNPIFVGMRGWDLAPARLHGGALPLSPSVLFGLCAGSDAPPTSRHVITAIRARRAQLDCQPRKRFGLRNGYSWLFQVGRSLLVLLVGRVTIRPKSSQPQSTDGCRVRLPKA